MTTPPAEGLTLVQVLREVADALDRCWPSNAAAIARLVTRAAELERANAERQQAAAPDRSRAMEWDAEKFVRALVGDFRFNKPLVEVAEAAYAAGVQQRAVGVPLPEEMPAWFPRWMTSRGYEADNVDAQYAFNVGAWDELRASLTSTRQSEG